MFQCQSIFVIIEFNLFKDDKLLLATVKAIPLMQAQVGDIL